MGTHDALYNEPERASRLGRALVRRRRPHSALAGCVLAGAALVGCSEGGGGGAATDAGVTTDMGGMEVRPDLDLFDAFIPPPDAGPEPGPCLLEGGEIVEQQVSEPVEGLTGVRGDHDLDGDGLADVLLELNEADPPRLEAIGGISGEPIVTISGASGHLLSLVHPTHPSAARPSPWAPVEVMGARALFVAETPAPGVDGQTRLRAVDVGTGEDIASAALPSPAAEIRPLLTGGAWRTAVTFADGSCGIYDLGDAPEQLFLDLCRVQPAWDANGDGQIDFIYSGGLGLALIDGPSLEDIARESVPGHPVPGFVAIDDAPEGVLPGPESVRGNGPELVSVSIADGQLVVRYHREDLFVDVENAPLVGTFLRAELFRSSDGLRLVVEEERGGLRYLQLYEPGTMRRRGEYGPYRTLSWDTGTDLDGDGAREIRLLHGPDESGIDGTQEFRALSDGDVVLDLESERNAAFELVLDRRGPLGALGELDGCEGVERLLLRTGNRAPSGNIPSRVLVLAEEGRQVFQGEPLSGPLHRMELTDLDGEGALEILEVRSDEAGGARWRVLAWPPFVTE